MAFFQFGRKMEFPKEYSLSDIPVFSSLTPSEQKLIEKKARLMEFKRGDIVYEEGTPPDAFYVVISGRFRLFLKPRAGGADKTLIYFHRGDHFSEASLLTGRMHSASVEAQRDGILLKLDKEDFLKLVKDFPTISLFLTRTLSSRLAKVNAADKHHHQQEVRITSLYAKDESQHAFQCWVDLAATLSEITRKKVILVDFVAPRSPYVRQVLEKSEMTSFDFNEMEPSRDTDLKRCTVVLPREFHYMHVNAQGSEENERKASVLITFLTYRYDYVLVRTPGDLDNFTFKLLKLCDGVYIYSEVDELDEAAQWLQSFQQSVGFSKSDIRMLIPDAPDKNALLIEEKEENLGLRIFTLIPSRTEQRDRYYQSMRFLAKEFAGTLLGLALGSGAAYGLAHIGVLKVLEREGIRADVVTGSSVGALVGAFWTAGYSADEIEEIAKTINLQSAFFKLLGFADLSIAHRGFFKGNQVTRWLETYLGNRTFRDLKIPFKVIAANLATSEKVVMESGRLVDAVRASISIPGIFRPVPYKDTHLIDGGVVDPLPIKELTSMGVKKIIAVNVLPGPKDRIERNRLKAEEMRQKAQNESKKQFFSKVFNRGKDKIYHRYAVNVFHVIMSTVQFLEYEIANSWGAQADVLIHPIVRDAHWAEFYNPDKFIRLGMEKTELQLQEIKHLISE